MYLVLMVIAAHLGMGAIDLPKLWGRPEVRREWWSVVILLLLCLCLGLVLAAGYTPTPAVKLLERLFGPVGSLLFKPKEQ